MSPDTISNLIQAAWCCNLLRADFSVQQIEHECVTEWDEGLERDYSARREGRKGLVPLELGKGIQKDG